tara:strand:+ start:731 stop:1111 length:381 start_codon:yes stop_codon:yes gene_type:complete
MPQVIENISLQDFKQTLNNLPNNNIIIIRFTAEWCKPCKNIDSLCNNYFKNCNDKIIPILIDIDEALDIYATLKRYKMLNGVPALLAFYGNNKQSNWFVPNDIVNTGNIDQVNSFLTKCETYAKSL